MRFWVEKGPVYTKDIGKLCSIYLEIGIFGRLTGRHVHQDIGDADFVHLADVDRRPSVDQLRASLLLQTLL